MMKHGWSVVFLLIHFLIIFIQIRGQIFSALHYLHREYEFYLPLVYLERRILELSMETCLNELKINGGMRFLPFFCLINFYHNKILKHIMAMTVSIDGV